MELFLHQVLAGLATGGIYACMALAVVMIYQAIDHLNFAQGEMAMFSTFIAWQLLEWGVPFWGAFVITVALSFLGAGIAPPEPSLGNLIADGLEKTETSPHLLLGGLGKPLYGRLLEDPLHPKLHLQRLPDSAYHPRRQQRVPAKLEEVFPHSYARSA